MYHVSIRITRAGRRVVHYQLEMIFWTEPVTVNIFSGFWRLLVFVFLIYLFIEIEMLIATCRLYERHCAVLAIIFLINYNTLFWNINTCPVKILYTCLVVTMIPTIFVYHVSHYTWLRGNQFPPPALSPLSFTTLHYFCTITSTSMAISYILYPCVSNILLITLFSSNYYHYH